MGRAELIQDLMAKGFSYRESKAIVNAVLDTWKEHLIKHGEVDTPFGTLQVSKRTPTRVYLLGRILRLHRKTKVRLRKVKNGRESLPHQPDGIPGA